MRYAMMVAMTLVASICNAQMAVRPGDDLQAVLDNGDDLVLKPSMIYNISKTLVYKKPGQKIYTKGARYPSQFATLKIADKNLTQLVNATGIKGAVLEHVLCDGRRYELSVPPKRETSSFPSLVLFGGSGGDEQVIRKC